MTILLTLLVVVEDEDRRPQLHKNEEGDQRVPEERRRIEDLKKKNTIYEIVTFAAYISINLCLILALKTFI